MMNRIPTWFLLFLPGILLWLAWPPMPVFVFLFLGFIPLFELEQRMQQKSAWGFFHRLYLALLLWNILTTWWVWNSTAWGCVTMLIFNSLFMCIPWLLYRFFNKRIGEPASYLFVIFWLLYEFLHHRWDLSWPWLTLGNGLAGTPWLIQWYDITGTLGGSAFVLAMNILIWKALRSGKKLYIISAPALLLFVYLSSQFNLWKYRHYAPKPTAELNAVVLQPSFDPWNEKFDSAPLFLINEMLRISATSVDSTTDILVWPETSLTDYINIKSANFDYQIYALRKYMARYPKMRLLTGANMEAIYLNSAKRPSGTARQGENPTSWWDAYNSAIFLDSTGNVGFYHKSKLVPGTEQMPFVEMFPFIDKLAVSLDENSITGSLGSSDSAIALGSGNTKFAPVICYESIYGDYISEYVNHGAQAIAIVTNDAWWGNTPGYKQHLAYGALRAIEQRKWIVRSANTGTSCFVNPEGEILQATSWWEKKSIKNKIYLYDKKTIYCRIGDTGILIIIGSICIVLGAILFRKRRFIKP